jgi:hypothetical protein
MAVQKFYLDRLKKKYGYHKESLAKLMHNIILFNDEKLTNAIGRMKQEHFKQQNSKIKNIEKRFILPDISEVLPKRSISTRKSVIRGNLITDNFKDALTKDLRNTLDEFKKTGQLPWVRRAGKKAGEMNAGLIDSFKERITKTFENYTKRDPKYGGVPSNIRNIAVTEVTGTINQVKKDYHDRMMVANPGIKATKTWIHNTDHGRIKIPRKSHFELHGKTIPHDEKFKVIKWMPLGKRWIKSRTDLMDRPHDIDAPLDQVVGCMCGVTYNYSK